MFKFYKKTKLNLALSSLGALLPFLLSIPASADDYSNIGCGNPGLKVIARELDPNVVVIYHESPETPFGGFSGTWMTNENIQVIVDCGYHFEKADVAGSCPRQLYPFGSNSVFTDETGEQAPWYPTNNWIADCSHEACYTLTNGTVKYFRNAQQVARARYHLGNDEIFLGFIDSRVFFCKNVYRPRKVFWREPGSQKEYYYPIPKSVTEVFGVMKPFHPGKDVGLVALHPTPFVWPPWDNLFLPPYSDYFIEISFSKGKLVHSK